MSDFEDRVKDAAGQLIGDRFKILKKLDPEIAERYVIGVNQSNEQKLRDGSHSPGSANSARTTRMTSWRPRSTIMRSPRRRKKR
jgi:hypothetical protein